MMLYEQNTREYPISGAGFTIETNANFIPNYLFRESYYNIPILEENPDLEKGVKIRYIVEPIEKQRSIRRYSSFQKTGSKEIYFDRNIGPFEVRFLLKYEEEEVTMRVNREYHNLIPTSIGNLPSPGALLTDISRILLLKQGLAPLHCSSFIDENTGYVIFGPSGAGKTSMVLSSIRSGGQFISEDIAIADGRMIFGCPHTFTAAQEINQVNFEKMSHKIYQKLSTVPILGHYPRSRITKELPPIIDEKNISYKTRIDTVIILMPDPNFSLMDLSSNEAIRQIRNFNRSAFLSRSGLLPALDYFGIIDIDDIVDIEYSIIENIVEDTVELFALQGSPKEFTKYISERVAKR